MSRISKCHYFTIEELDYIVEVFRIYSERSINKDTVELTFEESKKANGICGF